MTMFFGLWNCSQSRSATKRCMASFSDVTVLVVSGMVMNQSQKIAPHLGSAGPMAPLSPARHQLRRTSLDRRKEGESSDRYRPVKLKYASRQGGPSRLGVGPESAKP